MTRGVALLDRDGVINELVPRGDDGHGESPLRTEDVRLLSGAVEGLRQLEAAGFLLACVTNQPSAAKGLISLEEAASIHARVVDLLHESGVDLAAERVCWHHPDAQVASLRGSCPCRKPEPGMLLDVLSELNCPPEASVMIGDTDTDVLAGQRAGVRTMLIETPRSGHKRQGRTTPTWTAPSLEVAARVIVRDHDPGLPSESA